MNKKIKLIDNKLNIDIKRSKKKAKINSIFSSIFSLSIIFLNFVIISLAIWAIIYISLNMNSNNTKTFILPIIVAIFTILMFITSIIISIFTSKTKQQTYQDNFEKYQYLILKMNEDESLSIDEILEIVNKIKNDGENDIKKVSYKKMIKKTLEGKSIWK